MRSVELAWRGKTYTIPANRAFEIGEQVEDIATLAEIGSWGSNPKMFKMAKAYGAMLRFAGCKVSDNMVLEEITPGNGDTGAAAATIKALIDLLLCGAKSSGDGDAPEKTSAS